MTTRREGRDENSIQDPKLILWAMQKCQLYHEGKIRLLYKLTGMEFLNKEYEDVHAWHDRYKGYHVLPFQTSQRLKIDS